METTTKVLDLFCGAGGLASGFAKAGFDVLGVDQLPKVPEIFRLNGFGIAKVENLYNHTINGGYAVVAGGPPCRPWSLVNISRRKRENPNFRYLARFASHIVQNRPKAFLLENVPPALSDAMRATGKLKGKGYSIARQTVRYSDFGAPTSRRRMIMFGALRSDGTAFFDELERFKKPATTVREAIGYLSSVGWGEVPDHVYPSLETIENYIPYYETGKYGWYRLSWNRPAPSFGNVVKTYTLHPTSWQNRPPRVISVREALLLMGFSRGFRFPPGIGMRDRYQMVADSVSPIFSYAAARATRNVI